MHTYKVEKVGDTAFDTGWLEGSTIKSIDHLKWGMYRFYVDALLYFGNIRSAYRGLRELSLDEISLLLTKKRVDTGALSQGSSDTNYGHCS